MRSAYTRCDARRVAYHGLGTRLVRSKASKLNAAIKNLETRLGRHPTEIELAEELQISVAELEKMIVDANAVNLISLNKKWYETDSYKDVRKSTSWKIKRAKTRRGACNKTTSCGW